MVEVYIPIHNFLGLYEISNFGNVRSVDRLVKRTNRFGTVHLKQYNGKLLSPKINRGGYLEVNLWKNIKVQRHQYTV